MSQVALGVGRQEAVLRATRVLLRRDRRQRLWTRVSLGVGLGILALVLVASVLQPVLPLPNPTFQNFGAVLQAPSWAHLFGTDSLGRDVFSETLAAAKLDLRVAVIVTSVSVAIGLALGAAAGFFGGFVDAVIMRLADVVLAVPFLVLILALVAVLGPGLNGVYVGVPLAGWAIYARLTRAEMLVVREKEYVLAAQTLGFGVRRTLLRHAVPNVWRPAFVYSFSDVVGNIMLLATLSYLGVGAQPPTPEWGAIIAGGQSYLLTAWWISTLPGLFVVVVGIGFALVGDALADMLGEEVKLAV